jgi:hypothetical protein
MPQAHEVHAVNWPLAVVPALRGWDEKAAASVDKNLAGCRHRLFKYLEHQA